MKIYFTDSTDDIINTIFCLGLNYSDHITDMSHKQSETPVIFIKPETSICYNEELITIPNLSQRMDYELEMLIYLKQGGMNLNAQDAGKCIGAYGVGIDLTLRDLQQKAKEKGLPWSVAKGFFHSAPISYFKKVDNSDLLNNLNMQLYVNNQIKQTVNTSQMIFKPIDIICYLSHFFPLKQGDIIFTGTPSGIGQLYSGDRVYASIDGDLELNISIR
ncbi:MAG: fumarylacetoacetate hydrolase family protein [Candidatus Cloacimonetes bacterium]|nr:fumarylacetoacetate hydrolase family protein [Candidatus Cloacimonadota bacterium]